MKFNDPSTIGVVIAATGLLTGWLGSFITKSSDDKAFRKVQEERWKLNDERWSIFHELARRMDAFIASARGNTQSRDTDAGD